MRFQVIFFTTILFFTILLAGCPSATEPPASNNVLNTANGNVNAVNGGNVNSPFNPTKKPETATTNNAPTITPVVNAYYNALKKKDDAALRKVMTQAFIKNLEADMKADGGKSLAAYAAELEDLTKTIEVRNEKIEGDKATAEIKGGTYVNWTPFEFAKENGEWKFTGESPDSKSVPPSNSNAK
jgi:hypothetical protein